MISGELFPLAPKIRGEGYDSQDIVTVNPKN